MCVLCVVFVFVIVFVFVRVCECVCVFVCVLLCVCVGQQGHALAQNSVLALNSMFAGPQARHMHAWKQGRGLAPPTLCINNGAPD